MKWLSGLGLLVIACFANSAAATPFADGSFEPPGMTDVGTNAQINITGTTNGAWTANNVGNTQLLDGDFFSIVVTGGAGSPPTGNDAFDGTQYIGFNSGTAGAGGAIFQAFDTVINQQYTVTFHIATGAFSASNQRIIADVTGSGPSLGGTTEVPLYNVWTSHSFNFTADSTTSTLTFTDDLQPGGDPNSADLLLDGVSVTVVPEPATITMLLLGSIGLGLAARRRQR